MLAGYHHSSMGLAPGNQANSMLDERIPGGVSSYWWQRLLRRVDDGLMSVSRQLAGSRGALIVLMFHGLFRDEAEAFSGNIDPYQPFSVNDLAVLIKHFQRAGFRFVSPAELEDPLKATDKCVLLTFDDGYANNLRAIPILKRFNVPATFFVAAGNVASGEPFWWDVLYRERNKGGATKQQMVAERQRLKSLNNAQIKEHLRNLFGSDIFTAQNDSDRPMSITELKQIAREPLATIGNHTVDHELLPRIPIADARREIAQCQEMLKDWLGEAPRVIAYPNGVHNAAIVKEAANAGLKLGVTSIRGKLRLPLDPEQKMRLPRYAMIGGPTLSRHCQVVIAPFSMSGIKHAILSRRQQSALP
jgi:peptidoglycan/xylan/chitin deacetylase (PgdA/CDA1 family)